MAEEEKKENEFVYVDGHFTNLEALARKIQAGIIAAGGEIHADEDAILSAFGGFDLTAHVTDSMDDNALGQFLEEFAEAWRNVAGPGAKEAGE